MLLTIFTPTYNRAYCLHRVYDSLCRQSCRDFEWLVIDDGSNDNTHPLVEGWIKDNKIPIRYIYQKNQGMHGAHNTAYRNLRGELNMCIDSDDWLPDDAVEKISRFWSEHKSGQYAGFVALNENPDGSLRSHRFPKDAMELFYEEIDLLTGQEDKKMVFLTSVITRYPEYPVFPGEKYLGLDYKCFCMGHDYKFLTLNQPLCVVDYQRDGSGYNMYTQYWNNPRGFAFYRRTEMQHCPQLKRRFIVCAHYVSSSIRSRNRHFLKESPRKALTLLAVPAGIALYCWIRWNVGKGKKLDPYKINQKQSAT